MVYQRTDCTLRILRAMPNRDSSQIARHSKQLLAIFGAELKGYRQLWRDLGVPENHILPGNAKDNFWGELRFSSRGTS